MSNSRCRTGYRDDCQQERLAKKSFAAYIVRYVYVRNFWRDCHWYFGDRGNLHAGSDDDYQINEFYIVFLESIKELWWQILAEENNVRLSQVSSSL